MYVNVLLQLYVCVYVQYVYIYIYIYIYILLLILGGVGITLGMIAIAYHKLSKKFELVQEENRVGESGLESTQWNFCEGKGTLTKYNSNYKSHQPWDREDSPYLGSDMLENHFTCHKCSPTAHAVGKHKREIVLQKETHVGEQLANHQHEGSDQHSLLQQRIKGKLASTPFALKYFKCLQRKRVSKLLTAIDPHI